MEVVHFKKIDKKVLKGTFTLQIPEDGIWIGEFKLFYRKDRYSIKSITVKDYKNKDKDLVFLTKTTRDEIVKKAVEAYNSVV